MNEKESKIKAVNIFAIVFSLLVVAFIAVSTSIDKTPAVASQTEKHPIASTVADPIDITLESPAAKNEEPQENKVVVTVDGTEIT